MLQQSQTWDSIAECIDSYLKGIRTNELPPSIDSFLPREPGPVRNLAIIELAKIEMEHLASVGLKPCVDEYLMRFPELSECTGGAPLDLILEEIRLRQISDPSDSISYTTRFPQHANAIQRFIALTIQAITNVSRSLPNVQVLLKEGATFGDFQILKLLGSGSFAKVFLARQTTMMRMVALKVSADSGDEAKTLAQLDHPNVIRVYDVRCVPEQRLRILSMQYVPGGTLADVIRDARSIEYRTLSGGIILRSIDRALVSAGLPSPEESSRRARLERSSWLEAVCEIGVQLSEALDYAHRNKVLHRDVKPANVLLTAEGISKLADFNISYSQDLAGTNPSSYFGGSLSYMSPEQLQAASWNSHVEIHELDERSDVFSLACVLWELLTTERPWPNDALQVDWGATIDELLRRRMTEPPRIEPELLRSESIRRVKHCLTQALHPDRNNRTQSAAILAGQLRLCMSPQAWRLLHPETRTWANLACRYPTIVALLVIFVPNGLAGAFNYNYNLAWLSVRYPGSHQHLIDVSVVMNVLSFGMGGVFFLFVALPVTREVNRRMRGDRSRDSSMIQRSISLGHRAAMFGLSLWLIAGILFPVVLTMKMPVFDQQDAVHFFLSLAVCGAIAVSYPFLGVSLLAVQVWYGVMIGSELRDPNFRERGRALMKSCDRYLLTATAVPLAGLAMLLSLSAPVRLALTFLVAASALGLFIAFRVHRRIQDSIETLTPALVPESSREHQ